MNIKRIIYIEDSTEKYMDVRNFLVRIDVQQIEWATNAEKGIEKIEKAMAENNPYDLLLVDMHFDYFGSDDHEAGEKTMKFLRNKGYEIPVIFCSSQNWKIPGALGNIFYNPRRDWELEAEELFREIRKM